MRKGIWFRRHATRCARKVARSNVNVHRHTSLQNGNGLLLPSLDGFYVTREPCARFANDATRSIFAGLFGQSRKSKLVQKSALLTGARKWPAADTEGGAQLHGIDKRSSCLFLVSELVHSKLQPTSLAGQTGLADDSGKATGANAPSTTGPAPREGNRLPCPQPRLSTPPLSPDLAKLNHQIRH